MPRRRRQQERQKSSGLNRQNNNSARASRFFFLYISLSWLHDYDVKMPNFQFYVGRKQATTKFFFLSLNLEMVVRNVAPEEFACIWQSKRAEIIEIEIEITRIHFLGHVSVAVAVVVSKTL